MQIIEAIKIAKASGLSIPIVYNTNSYENVETIRLLNGYIDVYLPDLKYFDDDIIDNNLTGIYPYVKNGEIIISK